PRAQPTAGRGLSQITLCYGLLHVRPNVGEEILAQTDEHKKSTAASPRCSFRRWPGRRLVGLPAQEGWDVEQIVLGADPRPLLGFERRQPWRGGGGGGFAGGGA